jgi:AraC family transcriptional activator of pobA
LEDKLEHVDPEKGIPPMRRRFHLVMLFLAGKHDLQIGASHVWLKPNDLMSSDESGIVQRVFQDIISAYERSSPERSSLVRAYIHVLLLRVHQLYRAHLRDTYASLTPEKRLASEFKHLLESNFVEMRQVGDYAAALHTSRGHLSAVVRESYGRSPRRLIQDMLLLEAKVLLGSTELSVSQIADRLRFHDPAHFSRFIHRHTGRTPTQLRKTLQ